MRQTEFQQIHFNGEGFHSLKIYRLFLADWLRKVKAQREAYDAEVAEWYATGEGAEPDWRTECDDDGNVWRWNAGGEGHTFPTCIHGSSRWTDYDNICGGCEDGGSDLSIAIGYAREQYLRFNARWDWACKAPGDLPQEDRMKIQAWALSLFPSTGE